MSVICPRCSHLRSADATHPDRQCPACGIRYTGFGSAAAEPARPVAYTPEVQQDELGMLLKIVLLVALGWGLNFALKHGQRAPDVDELVALAQPGPTSAASLDAGTLHSLSGRIERGCARNQYGLSEQACIARLHAREKDCVTQTGQRFPGPIGDAVRMRAVAKSYVGCIFDDEG